MESRDAPGEAGSQVTKTKSLSPEEISRREKLVTFLQAFVKAMLQTGYYSQDHPQAKKSKEGLYETFRNLLGDSREVNFLARFEKGVGKDIYIDGVTEETTSLNAVMSSAQSDLFLPKFADYFHRRGLLSFSLKNEVTEDEFDRFVLVMSESRRAQAEDVLQKGKALTRDLVDNKILHVSTVFDDDVVKIGRGVPWRVEMALLRLRKDLSVVPMFRHITHEKMTEVKRKVIEDVIRPIARPAYFVDLLTHAEHVLGDVEGLRDIDVENEIIRCIRGELLSGVCETFADKIPSAGSPKVEAEAAINTIRKILRKLGERMITVENTEAINALYRLHALGILDSKELPPVLRARIRTERMTEEFLQFPDRYIGAIRGNTNIDTYRSATDTMVTIYPELIHRGELEKAAETITLLKSHEDSDKSPFSDRPRLAASAIERMNSEANVKLLKSALNSSNQAARKHILAIFSAFGPRATQALLDVLEECKESSIRKSICQHISAAGESAVPSLLEMLRKPDKPWYLSRNILGILGEIGSTEAHGEILHYANHPHPRVREEALGTLQKIMGSGAELSLVHALNDKEPRVVARATALLGQMRSHHVKALEFYKQALSAESQMPEIIKTQVFKAVGHLGETVFSDGTTTVELLEKILSAGKSGKLFGLVKGSDALPTSVRCGAAMALGIIHTPKALAILKGHQQDKDQKVKEAVEHALRSAKS